MTLTRRLFLERLGALGGYGAVYLGMEALGLLNAPPASAARFALPAGSGRGRKIVILGAGIAGLVAAHELVKAGWDVTVLEARDRVGGRVWTLRGGDRVVQTGREEQICQYSDGLYFNAGAARIPAAHHVILGYAKKLRVPIEPMVNQNRAARFDVNGRVFTNRQLTFDMRGRLSELLAKAIDRHALDGEMSAGELSMMRQFLAFYGSLDETGQYRPDGRSGFAELPGGYQVSGRPLEALGAQDLAKDLRAIGFPLVFEEFFDQQAPMFQPVGGMDRIARALFETVRRRVRLSSPVHEIRRRGAGVRIVHGPGNRVTDAEHCLCTLPLNLLERIPSDFSPAKKAAIKGITYLASVKVAFESPRFWEDEGVYGGLAWTDQLNENLIYPSGDWHGDKGILITAYCGGWFDGQNPSRFAALSHQERFRLCREVVERLHPGRSRLMTRPATVAWGLTPWSEGVGPISGDWSGGPRGALYAELLRPEGPIHFAGEHLSYVPFWQEGAALSAHEALRQLTAQAAELAA